MKSVSGSRFPQPLSATTYPTPQEMKENSKPFVPTRTMCNSRWAVNVFNQWVAFRNSQPNALLKCRTNLLEMVYPTTIIDDWLAAFILEARRIDGDFYPDSTLKNILAALFRMIPHLVKSLILIHLFAQKSWISFTTLLNSNCDSDIVVFFFWFSIPIFSGSNCDSLILFCFFCLVQYTHFQ